MIIKENHSMATAVLENHAMIELLPRFGISLGFGEKTVAEVCVENGVNPLFFLEIVNTKINDDYQSGMERVPWSVEPVVHYLQNTHRIYLDEEIPRVEEMITTLIHDSSLDKEKKRLVINFFNDYKQQFLEHVSKEEDEILPYSLEVLHQGEKVTPDPAFAEYVRKNPISRFAREHDRLEDALGNLAKLIIKYLPPFEDRQLCNSIMVRLFYLHDDLIDHAHIEDAILVPLVESLEKKILQSQNG